MAMPINSSPILIGESARIFIEEAEKNSKRPVPRLTKEREEELRETDRKSREFVFPPKKV